MTQKVVLNRDYVVFAIDMHKEGDILHPETKLFPPHNIVGTDGRKLYGSLEGVYQTNKDSKDVHWMDKTRYSSFTGTDLELQLRTRGIQELHLCGVATNICILHTAIDAYYKGFDIFVYQDAVTSFDADGHVWALKHFKILLEQQLYNVHH